MRLRGRMGGEWGANGSVEGSVEDTHRPAPTADGACPRLGPRSVANQLVRVHNSSLSVANRLVRVHNSSHADILPVR